MPIIILIAITSFLFVVWVVKKLKNSRKFDRVVEDLTTQELPLEEPKTGEVISKIGAAEQALKKRASADKKEAERLQKDANVVGDFLTDRRVVKADKTKEGDGQPMK